MQSNKYFKTRICANYRSKAKKLGLEIPSDVWILPNGFEQQQTIEDVYYQSDYDLVTKLLRKEGISYSLMDKNKESYTKLSQHSFEFVILPLITFLIETIAKNPQIITSVLSPLSEFFKKRTSPLPDKDNYMIRSKIIKEVKNSTFKEYSYEGPPDKYDDFIKFVKDDKDDR